jgi:hypothetical protein
MTLEKEVRHYIVDKERSRSEEDLVSLKVRGCCQNQPFYSQHLQGVLEYKGIVQRDNVMEIGSDFPSVFGKSIRATS